MIQTGKPPPSKPALVAATIRAPAGVLDKLALIGAARS